MEPTIRPVFGRNALSVTLFFGALFLVLLCLGLFAVAKTGIVDIPLFSRWYVPLQPVRHVEAAPITEAMFQAEVSERLATQVRQNVSPPYKIMLTEQELTAGLRGAIGRELRAKDWMVTDPQLAVLPDGIEIFLMLRRGSIHPTIRARLRPVVKDGALYFSAVDIHVGNYPIDPHFADQLTSLLFERNLGTWVISFATIRLESAALRNGALDLFVSPASP